EGLVQAPEGAGKGTAKVALSLDAWKPGDVKPATVEVPVQVIEAAESPQLAATFKGHEESIWKVAWSPDGKMLAGVSSRGSEVTVWDVAERKERTKVRTDLGDCYGLEFLHDGRTIALGHWTNDPKAGPTGCISLWDVATGQQKSLYRHDPPRGV